MLVSIITVTRNDFSGLKNTLDSLKNINKKFRYYFEHIIVDGLSSDQTISYLNNYIKYSVFKTIFISERDSGIYDAMNKGVSASNGNYCFFLNSGDIIDNDVDLNNFLEVLKFNLKVSIVAGIAFNVKVSSEHTSYLVVSRAVKKWRLRMPTVHQGIIYKTLYLINNKYDDSLRICSDFKSVVVALDQNLFFVNVNANFTILTFGGISSQRPFLLMSESLSIVINSSINIFCKIISCSFIIVNVFLFQIYFRLRLIKKIMSLRNLTRIQIF